MTFLPILLCISIAVSSCNDEEGDSNNMDNNEMPEVTEITIFPGQGLNTLSIGSLGSEVEAVLGNGFQPIINVGTSGNATYNYLNLSDGIDIAFGLQSSGDLDINTLPIEIFFLYPEFEGMTEEGIQMGSPKADVVAAYGEADIEDMWSSIYNIGMIIEYDDDDKVRGITISQL